MNLVATQADLLYSASIRCFVLA